MTLLFFFFFWDYDSNVGALNIVPEVSEVVLISFSSFFCFPLCFIYFHHSIFYLTYPIFCLSYSTVGSLQSVFISFIALFIIYWLFFISSRSLLNISCIFSILASSLFFCNSILFSRFWIIFTIIILNSFSGRLPISSSFVWFGGLLSCSFTCWIFLCLFSCLDCCVWGGLSVSWKFVVPLYCGGSSLWVGLDEWLVKVSWLVKLASVFWWVELDFFSLECNEVSSSEFWDVFGFGVTFGCLYFNAQGYIPALLENHHGMSWSGTCWLLDGAWFPCRYGGFWMSSCRLMFLESGVSWCSQVLDLILLSLTFSLILQ